LLTCCTIVTCFVENASLFFRIGAMAHHFAGSLMLYWVLASSLLLRYRRDQ
jgi:hypothetical protein